MSMKGTRVFGRTVILLSLTWLISAAPSRGKDLPPVTKTEWRFKGFPILAWWAPPGTSELKDFKLFKEAGFTIYTANPDVGFDNALKLAREAGLPIMPHRTMQGFGLPAPTKPAKMPENDPNVVGWLTHDEPGRKGAAKAAAAVNALMRADPTRWALYNNYPLHMRNVAGIAELGLRNGMPILSFDNYVIYNSGGSNSKEHFSNLTIARNLSLKYNVPFWAFALTSKHNRYRRPSESDVRWKQFTNLAYGAKGLWYFCYWGPHRWKGWDTKSIVDSATGKETELYHQVKKLNKTVLAMGDILLGLTSEAVAHTKPPKDQPVFEEGKHWITEIKARHALIGFFRDAKRVRYALVVNELHGKNRSAKEMADQIELTFSADVKEVEAVNWLDGTPGKLKLKGGKASLSIHGGTGVLLRVGVRKPKKKVDIKATVTCPAAKHVRKAERAERLFQTGRDAERMGQRNVARSFYKKIVENYPGTPAAKKAARKLQSN